MDQVEKDIIKKDLTVRLRRIQGQVKGIENMINNEACCKDVLVQIAAVRAAVNKAGALMLKNYAKECMIKESSSMDKECVDKEINNKDTIEELISTLVMFMK